uniref:lysozyme n=1 Tax=Triatoma infestans TaxID=30076 RepID=A0A161MHZ4_TRIIF
MYSISKDMEKMANLITILLLLFTITSAKVMTECELANTLENAGFSKDKLKDWVCLAKAVSSLNTTAVGGPKSAGSYEYGIFQINDRYWCDKNQKGKGCTVKCSDLILEDDIDYSVACARIIYNINGFSEWFGWIRDCKGKELPPLNC